MKCNACKRVLGISLQVSNVCSDSLLLNLQYEASDLPEWTSCGTPTHQCSGSKAKTVLQSHCHPRLSITCNPSIQSKQYFTSIDSIEKLLSAAGSAKGQLLVLEGSYFQFVALHLASNVQ